MQTSIYTCRNLMGNKKIKKMMSNDITTFDCTLKV